jgi:hypothetical protein
MQDPEFTFAFFYLKENNYEKELEIKKNKICYTKQGKAVIKMLRGKK